MEIILASDNSLGISLPQVAEFLSSETAGFSVRAATARFRLSEPRLHYEHEHAGLTKFASREEGADIVIFLTNLPYENNFFFEGQDGIYLMSLHGWPELTDLPIANRASLSNLLDHREVSSGCRVEPRCEHWMHQRLHVGQVDC